MRIFLLASLPGYSGTLPYSMGAFVRRPIHERLKIVILFCESRADFNGDLPMCDFAVFYVATGFDDFKPAHVFGGLSGFTDGLFDSVLYADGGRAGQFYFFINMVRHDLYLC